MLFEIAHYTSKEYGDLSPLKIYKMSFAEIIDLYADIRRTQIREKRMADPDRVIMKPATNWF